MEIHIDRINEQNVNELGVDGTILFQGLASNIPQIGLDFVSENCLTSAMTEISEVVIPSSPTQESPNTSVVIPPEAKERQTSDDMKAWMEIMNNQPVKPKFKGNGKTT